MGFFSDILAGLELEKRITNEKTAETPVFSHIVLQNGESFVGPSRLLRKANDYISNCRTNGKPSVIVISGEQMSGKSVLAKAIMESNGMRYSRIFMKSVQDGEKPLRLFGSLLPTNGGIIIEEADAITNPQLLNAMTKVCNRSVVYASGKRIPLYRMIIIVVLKKNNTPRFYTQNKLVISLDYTRDDYVKMYLGFCEESGHSFANNKVRIDNRVLCTVGGVFNNNIGLFKEWVYRLMEFADHREGVVVNADNLLEVLLHTLDLDMVERIKQKVEAVE